MKCMMTMVAAALALAAVAQDGAGEVKPHPRPPRPAMVGGPVDPVVRAAFSPKAAEKLGLTEEQSARLKGLADDRDVMRALQEKVRKGMDRQAELLKAEKIDEGAVMAAIDDVFETRKEIAKRQTKRLIAVKAILTPEQIAKASEMLKANRKPAEKKPDEKKPGEKKPKKEKKPQGEPPPKA